MAAAVAFVAPFAARAAPEINVGDLVVSDRNGARVLVVDPATGDVGVLTPRAGSGTNLLVAPGEVALDAEGTVYVVDRTTNRLVAIDPQTGEQSVVTNQFVSPIVVGDEPWGLAGREDGGGLHLYASSPGTSQIVQIEIDDGVATSVTALSTELPWAGATGLGLGPTQIGVALDDGQGLRFVSYAGALSDPLYYEPIVGPPEDLSPGRPVLDTATSGAGQLYFTMQEPVAVPVPGCDAEYTALVGLTHVLDRPILVPLADHGSSGGLLRCPIALAFAADGETLYITDTLIPPPGGGVARILRWTGESIEVVADLPNVQGTLALPIGLAVSAVDAPEPSAALAGVALLAALAASCGRASRRTPAHRA